MATDAGADFDMVAILAGFDVEVLVERIPVVIDDEFDLLGITCGDADAAVAAWARGARAAAARRATKAIPARGAVARKRCRFMVIGLRSDTVGI
jgi:hypothetical protein